MGKRKKSSLIVVGGLLWFYILTVSLLHSVNGQATRCDPDTLGSGSGTDPNSACGDNSLCQNNAECVCNSGYFSPSGSQSDCQGNNIADQRCSQFSRDCVYCGSTFQGPCLKCTGVLYNRQCLSSCPDGTQLVINSINDGGGLAVRSCTGSATNQVLQEWAIIVIIVMGVVVLMVIAVLIAALACTCLRRSTVGQLNIAERQENQEKMEREEEEEETDVGELERNTNANRKSAMEEHFETDDDTYYVNEEEREEFFTRLNTLRDQSETFLKMLNDMRRRLKELPQNSQPVQQYKNVMRDLTRLLYMLNKKQDKIRIPPDGIQLLTWSEQILNRYLLAQGKSPVTSPTTSPSVSPQRISTFGDTAETDF